AATLLVALLGSESARAAPAAVARMRPLTGPRLFAAYSWRTLENERYVGEGTVAPEGATFERAVPNRINLPPWASHAAGANLGNVSAWSAGFELWGQVEIPTHKKRVAQFPGEHSYPKAVVFGRRQRHEESPAWTSPGPFVRTAYFTDLAIHLVAQ